MVYLFWSAFVLKYVITFFVLIFKKQYMFGFIIIIYIYMYLYNSISL